MKILLLSAPNPFKAAGIVSYDIFNGLSSIPDNDVRMLVGAWENFNNSKIKSIHTSREHYFNAVIKRLKRLKESFFLPVRKKSFGNSKVFEGDYFFEKEMSKTFYSTKKIIKRAGFNPDVILVLFMPAFISFKNLYELNKLTRASVFLYLMDMAPFTGGCHYAWDCKGYQSGCRYCPALPLNTRTGLASGNYSYKEKYTKDLNLHLIAGSEGQYIQLNKSGLFKNKNKHKILLPVNEKSLTTDKNAARQKLGLPQNKRIIFFGAVSADEKRKGLLELTRSLKILKENTLDYSNLHIAIAGNNNTKFLDKLSFSYTSLGYLEHNNLPLAFQAADIFVSPSIEDSGPMMVNQSIMFGTPVVAFEIGVALDLIYSCKTGYRAKLKDCYDFAMGIKMILDLEKVEYEKMRQHCKELGSHLLDSQKNCQDILNIFRNTL